METLKINTAVMDLFKKKVEKANRRATKLCMAPVKVTFGATTEEECGSDTLGAYKIGKAFFALYTEVHLDGEAPVINGYRFVGTVDLRGSKPVVRKQPYSDADLTRFFHTDGHCDHCNTLRARNDVIIVEDVETGELLQVGRSCAADFFRSKDASAMLACSDWAEAYGNITESSGRHEGTVALRRVFAVAAAVVRTFGWVANKDLYADNTLISTRSRVWSNLFPNGFMKSEDIVTVTKADEVEADVVINWLTEKFLDKDADDCTQFDLSVRAAVEGDNVLYVRDRNLNYVIWGIGGYKRDLQKDAENRRRLAEKAKQATESEFVGAVGERTNMVLTLTFKRAFGSDYGVKYMQKFVDADNNVVVWWGTNDVSARTVVGNTYTLKATVKDHTVYDGVNQTLITRAALVSGDLEESDA